MNPIGRGNAEANNMLSHILDLRSKEDIDEQKEGYHLFSGFVHRLLKKKGGKKKRW